MTVRHSHRGSKLKPRPADSVLVLFSSPRCRRGMTDDPDRLSPATPDDIADALAFALPFEGRTRTLMYEAAGVILTRVKKASSLRDWAAAIAKRSGPGKAQIFEKTGLTASAGISYNKFLAKLASDNRKPDGQFVVTPAMGGGFVEGLPIGKFHGVGPVTAHKMSRLGIFTRSDLRNQSLASLQQHFGMSGPWYHAIANGEDDRPVVPNRPRKSSGRRRTFTNDLTDPAGIEAGVLAMADQVWAWCEKTNAFGRTVTVKDQICRFQAGHAQSISVGSIHIGGRFAPSQPRPCADGVSARARRAPSRRGGVELLRKSIDGARAVRSRIDRVRAANCHGRLPTIWATVRRRICPRRDRPGRHRLGWEWFHQTIKRRRYRHGNGSADAEGRHLHCDQNVSPRGVRPPIGTATS